MFTVTERDGLRDQLLAHAERDPDVVAAALVGSAARDEEDEWSDIDLALRLDPAAGVDQVCDAWTSWLTGAVEIADTLDIRASGALYRVFLCANSLQVDVSFFPWARFRATNGESMMLVFGEAASPEPASVEDWRDVARMAWLYALHARSAVGRGRVWQADMMLAEVRARLIALACIRLGLNPSHGRAAHQLPRDFSRALADARAAHVGVGELRRSLDATVTAFLEEVRRHDEPYAARLERACRSIADPDGWR